MSRGIRTEPEIEASIEDKIYAAGFVDGEGCITVRYTGSNIKAGRTTRASIFASVTISQADPYGGPLMRWFQERWGGNLRHKSETKTLANDAWEWCVASRQAYRFLDDIRPWLKIKGSNADNALIIRELRLARGTGNAMTDDEYEVRSEIKRRANELNKRGLVGQDHVVM